VIPQEHAAGRMNPARLDAARRQAAAVARGTWKEFRDFAFRGNILELAVGVALGAAFNAVVQSLVGDLLTPVVGALGGNVDLAGATVTIGGAVVNIGAVVNTLIYFLLTALVLFFVVKALAKARRLPPAPVTEVRVCPFCCEQVAVAARRCGHCTSELPTLNNAPAIRHAAFAPPQGAAGR
jgi:large conductance mechanosensitive channel